MVPVLVCLWRGGVVSADASVLKGRGSRVTGAV